MVGHLCSGTGTAFAGWGPLGQGFWLSGTSNAPHSLTSLGGYETMGQRVYARPETTPPPPAHRPGSEANTFWSLKLREPHLRDQTSVQISRLRRTTRARMGNITSILPSVFRIKIGKGYAHLLTCLNGQALPPLFTCAGAPTSLGAPSRGTSPVVGKSMGGRVAGGWVHGLGRAPGTEGEGVCEGKTRGGFLGAPLL